MWIFHPLQTTTCAYQQLTTPPIDHSSAQLYLEVCTRVISDIVVEIYNVVGIAVPEDVSSRDSRRIHAHIKEALWGKLKKSIRQIAKLQKAMGGVPSALWNHSTFHVLKIVALLLKDLDLAIDTEAIFDKMDLFNTSSVTLVMSVAALSHPAAFEDGR